MERFLNCISQVYFQQESFDAILSGSGKDKAAGKILMQSAEYGSQQQQQPQLAEDMPGVDN